MSKNRSWISPPGYRELATKYGTVRVSFSGSGFCNVEVRDPIDVAGGQFRGTFTVTSEKGPYGSIVGRITYWNSALTLRREKLLLEEVLVRVREAAEGPMEDLVREAAVREANNTVLRAEEDLRDALKAASEARSHLLSALAEEGRILGVKTTSDLLGP
jgi:hypothetical protein